MAWLSRYDYIDTNFQIHFLLIQINNNILFNKQSIISIIIKHAK